MNLKANSLNKQNNYKNSIFELFWVIESKTENKLFTTLNAHTCCMYIVYNVIYTVSNFHRPCTLLQYYYNSTTCCTHMEYIVQTIPLVKTTLVDKSITQTIG